ncbi:MAG: hypothetical protein ACD_79C00869G0006 [uncultured bacterium]|nr:MAG: hypothetical protein ACD_79C00869G0006 [uncultured bacterium]
MEEKIFFISIIIPCLNEEANIPVITSEIIASLKPLNIEWEVIFIDDGSSDNTWQTIQEASKINSKIIGFKHPANLGIVEAWKSGLENSKGDYVLTTDADLQYSPKDIPLLIEEMNKHQCDIVQGWRAKQYQSILRIILSKVFSVILNICFNLKLHDIKSGFVLYRKDIFKKILDKREGFKNFQHLIMIAASHLGAVIHQVPISFYQRHAGTSYISSPLYFSIKSILEVPKAMIYFRRKRK